MVERVRRLMWLRSERGKTYISSGLLLPSRVTHLVIKRPLHLDFRPGDYVFVNIPVIAGYEWHPFTISSAPEQEGKSTSFCATSSFYPHLLFWTFIFNSILLLSSQPLVRISLTRSYLRESPSQSPCDATFKSCLLILHTSLYFYFYPLPFTLFSFTTTTGNTTPCNYYIYYTHYTSKLVQLYAIKLREKEKCTIDAKLLPQADWKRTSSSDRQVLRFLFLMLNKIKQQKLNFI